MKHVRRHTILLGVDANVTRAVRDAAADLAGVFSAADPAAFEAAIRFAPPVTLVVVGARAGDISDGPDSAEWAGLIREFPACAFVLAVGGPGSARRRLRAADSAGAHEVLIGGSEATPAAVAVRLRLAEERLVLRLVDRLFWPTERARTLAILTNAILTAAAGGDARSLATRLGVDRRSLSQWCSAARLPPPRRLLAWTRLLLAALLLDNPWRSVGEVAAQCGYAHRVAFTTACRNLAGSTPRDLRARGALTAVRSALRADLKRYRSRAVVPAPPGTTS